ncbi:MAG TPA: hypothetical protein VMF58_01620 [Rhizomicrobium sp.]|nr:hypothetical protein [Rhizomicrobium sp.]
MQQTTDQSIDVSASLMHWAIGGSGNEDLFAQLDAHPDFDRAARALASNMLNVAAGNESLDGIFKDAGRYVAALWALYAHVTGGLTLPRLKEICAASKLVSPGRARALLLYLRYLGYIESAGRDQNRVARYVPTAPFIATWTAHLRAALEAARMIEPSAGLVLRRLHDPAVLETFSRFQGEELLAGAQNRLDMNSPYVRIFMNRHAGSQVIMLLATGSTEGAFPTEGAMAFSTAAVAKRFKVSRIHIKRMLDQGEKEGFLRRQADGAIVLEEAARATIRRMYVMQLAQLLSQAARTLRERPEILADTRADQQPEAA